MSDKIIKDYYKTLRITKNVKSERTLQATQETIKNAYDLRIASYKTVVNEEEYKDLYDKEIAEINEAYEILSNPIKRKIYDQRIKIVDIPINNTDNKSIFDLSVKDQVKIYDNLEFLCFQELIRKGKIQKISDCPWNDEFISTRARFEQIVWRVRSFSNHQ